MDASHIWHRSRELRFLVVGAWNTVFGYLVFVALYWLLKTTVHYLAIAVAAHLLAVTQSFAAQRRLVFRAKGPLLPQYLRFHLSSVLALGFNLGALYLLVEVFGMEILVAQAIATVLTVAASYLLHLHFSFRKSR